MNKNDIKKWISDNEQDLFCDPEEPKYIPSPVVEDFIDELAERQVVEILKVKKNAFEAFRLFVENYCAESGRRDISESSEHYMKVFSELINV